jgi:hypothetical protein
MRTILVSIVLTFYAMSSAFVTSGSREPIEYSALAVQYIGPTDHPVSPVTISDSKAGTEWCRVSVMNLSDREFAYTNIVSLSLLGKLQKEGEAYQPVAAQELKNGLNSSDPFKFNVYVVRRGASKTFQLSAKSTFLLLRDLKTTAKGDDQLASSLSYLQNWIRYMGKAP